LEIFSGGAVFTFFAAEAVGDFGGGGDFDLGIAGLLFFEVFSDDALFHESGEGGGHDVEVESCGGGVEEGEHHDGHHVEHDFLLLGGLGVGLCHGGL